MRKIFICTATLLKRHLKINILMILQIIVTLYILTGFTGQLQYLYKASGITDTFNDCDAFYYYPYQNNDSKDSVQNILKENNITDVSVGDIVGIVALINGKSEAVTAYNSVTLEYTNIELESGKWITEYKNSDFIPVVSMNPEYRTGEKIKINDNLGVEHDGLVCGQISKDDYILSFSRGGSSNISDLSYFVSHPDTNFIVPYNCDDICSVTDDFNIAEIDGMPIFSAGKIILPNSATNKEEIKSALKMYGDVTDVRAMAENYDKNNRIDLMITGIILLMFSVLTVTGIGGVNGLQNHINKRYYIIWYMTGLKTGDCAIIEFCRVAALAVSSFICYLMIYYFTPLKEIMRIDSIVISKFTFIFSFVFILLLFCITSLSYVIKLGRGNIILNYKNQD